jgi:RpiB/LacA/LacB family sugar-phosphate isomerase
MKVYIGADHRGYAFKKKIVRILKNFGCAVVDMGTHDDVKSCDYPKLAYQVATRVAKSKNDRGMLVCMSGVGQTIAANKVKGAYAALCHTVEGAKLAREHNNSNILVLGAKFVKSKDLSKIIQTWLETEFEGGRHLRRINQIKRIEKGHVLK